MPWFECLLLNAGGIFSGLRIRGVDQGGVHGIQERLSMAVVVLGELPHEDTAEMALAQGVGDFGGSGGGVVVGDEAVALGVGVEQIRCGGEVVEIFSPLARGKNSLDSERR